MSGHRAAHDMAQAPLDVIDPGDAGVIVLDKFGAICELVTTAAGGETRTLTAPDRPGILAVLRMKTDGGDAVVTASAGWNAAGNTAATFDAVGEELLLTSVSATTGFRWDVLANIGTVGLA